MLHLKSLKFSKIFIFLFFIINIPSAFSEGFQDVLAFEKDGKNDKALELCYKSIRNDDIVPDQYLDKIFQLESNTGRILESVALCADKIKNKEKFFRNAASLSLMTGNYDTARNYYDKVYLLKPSDNLDALYLSGVILYEQGDLETSANKFKLVMNGDKKEFVTKAKIMNGAIECSKGNKDKGLTVFNEVLEQKEISDDVLYLLYDVACTFKLVNVANSAKSRLSSKSYQNRLAQDSSSIPVTPSRIFTSSLAVEKAVISDSSSAVTKEVSIEKGKYIQTGSFSNSDNAKKMAQKIELLGLKPEIQSVSSNGVAIQKVIIRITEEMDVNTVMIMLKDNGIPTYLVF